MKIFVFAIGGVFIRSLLISFCCLVVGLPRPTYAGELTIVTEEVPPYCFLHDGKADGALADLVRAIQQRIGGDEPIKVMPWARAYHLATHEPNVLIFPTIRNPEREAQFKWVGPVQRVSTRIMGTGASRMRLADVAELRQIGKIGTIRGYYYESDLAAIGVTNLDPSPTPDSMLKKLFSGRVSAIVVDDLVAVNWLRIFGKSRDDLIPLFVLSERDLYLAFSKDTADETIALWQGALDRLKQDGSFNHIYRDRIGLPEAADGHGSGR